ncbi:2-Oxoglutarate synthase (gamma subunit) [Desulfatibacillum aliphaticivorans]|uniref:2-Oxoglutarate synthase (Gamma subunit) n=1 Tax=Desulfatibacillum aliphaticivorans TaxID=218208 RepID=B8FAM9_DESAL|nr:2-oxoacid:acceptor oxidoreductase family protein [Desulfatibacillum aliphaticivorans]ACL03325.1 2-Oxoglutarate synthase (gamma subunit) [Desulfatibacillum aliphaticivorans]
MQKLEVIITGFGGQGIVLAGRILGQAASLGDHKESTLIQSYGPESRGGACSAQVIISDGTINYPYVRQPDILAAMSQAGFDKFVDQVKPEGFILIDQDLVKPKGLDRDYFAVPSTRMAEELGRKMMANIIMIGFITAVTQASTLEATRETVTKSVPKGTEEMNIKAFSKGYDYGLSLLKARDKKASGQSGALA